MRLADISSRKLCANAPAEMLIDMENQRSATSPISQSDVETLRNLANSMGFGRTHDVLRRVIAACPYLDNDTAAELEKLRSQLVKAREALKAGEDAWIALNGRIGYSEYQALEDKAVALRQALLTDD